MRQFNLKALPKSWEEFCNENVILGVEETKQYHALMKLHKLRDRWRDGWKPDLGNTQQVKYIIEIYDEGIAIDKSYQKSAFLSFPDRDMAFSFVYFFRDLIEEAGDLI